jgi:uracil permease
MKEKLVAKDYLLAVQHLFAMFGATVLVPLLTGLNPSVALVTAGIGTLLFHLVTKGKVPVFLGSSFAFIAGTAAAVAQDNGGSSLAQGGIIVAGIVYLVFSLVVYFVGADKIKKLFPTVVTGPVIVVIGLSLAGVAVADASGANSGDPTGISWLIALFVLIVVILCNTGKKAGIFKLIPILIGMGAGYVLCLFLDLFGVFQMNFQPFADNAWFNVPYVTEGFFSLPKFDWSVILAIAPVALVTFMEHIGDITTNGAVVGKDFYKDPGLHRTLLGDGLATLVAGFFGGPANTTYSENTGVLAATKNYNPKILRVAALFAIGLGILGKFGAILQTIPAPVKGGIELVLFGMISAIGIRTLAESKTDMSNFRNIIVVALILVLGIGISVIGGIAIKFSDTFTLNLSGLFIATVIGVLANAIMPAAPDKDEVKTAKEATEEKADE